VVQLAGELRLWAEIVESDGTLERRLFHKAADTELLEVIDGWDWQKIIGPLRSALRLRLTILNPSRAL
jgi:hypothetical protein